MDPGGLGESVDDCELCLRTITGRFFFAELEATKLDFFFAPTETDDFLSSFMFSESGEGGCTTTCELVPTGESGSPSFSDSCGEMNRAVGRWPVVEGPLVFLRIGCGITVGVLDSVEEDVVLGLLWAGLWRVVALAAPVRNRVFLS